MKVYNKERNISIVFLNVSFIVALACVPSVLYVIFNLTSISLGFILSCLVGLVLMICMGRSLWGRPFLVSLLFFAILFLVNSEHFLEAGSVKLGGSIISIFIVCVLANLWVFQLEKINDDSFEMILKVVVILFLSFGLFGVLLKINSFGYEGYPKSIFFFYEPSNYAMNVSPFIMASLYAIKNKIYGLVCLLVYLIIAVNVQSLVMVVFWLFGVLLFFYDSWNKFFLIFFILIFLMFSLFFLPDVEYYTSRLYIAEDSDNLSALVYLQSWHEICQSLIDSNGLGLGFQKAGTNQPTDVAEKIYDMVGFYKNRNDAGFLMAKIVIEFGFLGLFVILVYSFKVVNFFVNVNANNLFIRFFKSMSMLTFLELYFRGFGYFTFGMFLIFSCAIYLYSYNHQ